MRLFTALTIGTEALGELERIQRTLKPVAPFRRWQPLHQAHLTLHFLGEVPEPELPGLQEALAATGRAGAPFGLALGPIGAFPSLRKPRVLWVGVGGDLDPLSALHADLKARFQDLGLTLEERRYAPHITIARELMGPVQAGGFAEAVAPSPWRVEAMTLFQSQLTPKGAIHTPLAVAPLGT